MDNRAFCLRLCVVFVDASQRDGVFTKLDKNEFLMLAVTIIIVSILAHGSRASANNGCEVDSGECV